MSSELELDTIYNIFGNPLEKQLADIRNQVARSRFQKTDDDNKLDLGSLGLNSRNYLKFANDHYNVATHSIGGTNYYPSFEPDYNTCKLWINTDHFGYNLVDDAGIPAVNPVYKPIDPEVPTVQVPTYPVGQDIYCYGEPKLESGYDRGYGDPTNTKKRQALHFNRTNSRTRGKEYIKVTDQAATEPVKSMRIIDGLAQTWIIRYKPDNFNADLGGTPSAQTLVDKIDAGLQNGIVIFSNTSAKPFFQVKYLNVNYAVNDNSWSSSAGVEEEIALVWNPAGATTNDKMKIYKNGVLGTNSTFTAVSWGSVLDTDLYIGKRGTSDGGYFQGTIVYVKMFNGFQATDANILNHYNNKLTLATINYGQVAVPDISVPTNV